MFSICNTLYSSVASCFNEIKTEKIFFPDHFTNLKIVIKFCKSHDVEEEIKGGRLR